MIRFLKITFLSFFIATSAVAGSDGELELSKKNNSTNLSVPNTGVISMIAAVITFGVATISAPKMGIG